MLVLVLTKHTGSYEDATDEVFGVFDSLEFAFNKIAEIENIDIQSISIDNESSNEDTTYTSEMFKDEIDGDFGGFYSIEKFILNE